MRALSLIYLGGASACLALVLGTGCRSSRPGTHVEIVERGGQKTYFGGAAAQGMSKSASCPVAVRRAVNAIALRFAQDNDGLADDIAEELGVSDGAVFLQRYAKDKAQGASVKNVDHSPTEYYCQAAVHWVPPVFVKEAVTKYALAMRDKELGAAQPEGSATTAPTSSGTQAPVATVPNTPPPGVVPPPQRALPAASCKTELKALSKTKHGNQGTVDQLTRCLQKTDGDRTICYGYVLRVDKAKKLELETGTRLGNCLNRELSATARSALGQVLPGHAAVVVENRDDGRLILWTFSPADNTAYVLEVDPEGQGLKQGALAANQVQWVRAQLGI